MSTTRPSFVDGAGGKALLPAMWERASPLVSGAVTLTLDALVAEQARARPDRTAIVDADARIAYEALDARANRLARVLTNAGVAPGDRVALLTHKSIDAIASMIAAMRAGLVYVPLDAQSPPARMAKILERCRPRIVVVGPGLIDTAAKLRAEAGVSPDTVFGQVGARSAAVLANAAFSEDDIERADATPSPRPRGPTTRPTSSSRPVDRRSEGGDGPASHGVALRELGQRVFRRAR
ncbi:MAG: AMP-binding protein [Acidobacteria bacterium]|nr:AMP-binding protein [Acidobacteriota bacterium]